MDVPHARAARLTPQGALGGLTRPGLASRNSGPRSGPAILPRPRKVSLAAPKGLRASGRIFLIAVAVSSRLAAGDDATARHILDTPTTFHGPGRDAPEPSDITEVRIGWYGPTGKQNHPAGRMMWRGASLAIDEANGGGGYRDRPFRLVARWDESPWTGGAAQVKVWAIIGSLDGPSTHIAEQLAAKARLAIVSPVCTDPSLTEANVPWMFRCAPSDKHQAAALVSYALDKRKWHRLAVVSCDDHDSRTASAEFLRQARHKKLAPVIHLQFHARRTRFEDHVKRLADARPQATFVFGPVAEATSLVRMLGQSGGEIVGAGNLAVRSFLTDPSAEAVTLVRLYDPSLGGAAAEDFQRRFEVRFSERPDYLAAYSYDATRLLIAAIRKAGLNRARIRDAIASMGTWQGVTGPIEWDNGGGNTRTVGLAKIVASRLVPVQLGPRALKQ